MMPNNSPWLKQLKGNRPPAEFKPDFKPDTVIVGGGIAGAATAYYTLRDTKDKVLMIEGGKVAHGATGHNAGQVVSDFERYLADIAEEFGAELAIKGWQAVESAWLMAEEIIEEAKLQTPFFQFTGYMGFVDLEELLLHLRDHKLLLDNSQLPDSGINTWKIMVAEDSPFVKEIPEDYKGTYSLVPHSDILSLLETRDKRYYALVAARRGVMNSALFTEEIVGYLLSTYPDRFALAENAWVDKVTLDAHSGTVELKAGGSVDAKRIVLCTNGFEKLKIENRKGIDIDTKFHHNVIGTVSYMAGYLEALDKPPTAIAYYPNHAKVKETVNADPYYYLTRRPFENEKNENHNLICVGGPEVKMEDTSGYTDEHPYSAKAQEVIDAFFRGTYAHPPKDETDYKFKWYGLMGYTPNGIRCIGSEPCNPVLMYNLGCNGIGILPSIYGGKRIARILAGEKMEKSIFDPRDATCPIE